MIVFLVFLASCASNAPEIKSPVETAETEVEPPGFSIRFSPFVEDGNTHYVPDGVLRVTAAEQGFVVAKFDLSGNPIWQKTHVIAGVDALQPHSYEDKFTLTPSFVSPEGHLVMSAWLGRPHFGTVLFVVDAHGEQISQVSLETKDAAILNSITWDADGLPYANIFVRNSIAFPGEKPLKIRKGNVVAALSKDFSTLRWAKSFDGMPQLEMLVVNDGLIVAGEHRHPVTLEGKPFLNRSEEVAGVIARLEKQSGELTWKKPVVFKNGALDISPLRLLGGTVVVPFTYDVSVEGRTLFVDPQTGEFLREGQESPEFMLFENHSSNPDLVHFAKFETTSYRYELNSEMSYHFKSKFTVKAMDAQGHVTDVFEVTVPPRFNFVRSSKKFIVGHVFEDKILLRFRLEDGSKALAAMEFEWSGGPTHIHIDGSESIFERNLCLEPTNPMELTRAIAPCAPILPEYEILVEAEKMHDGTIVLNPERSIGVTNPACYEEALAKLKACSLSGIYRYKIMLRNKGQAPALHD